MQPKRALAGALLATTAIADEAKARARSEVGILTCWARGSTGHLVTSTQVPSLPLSAPGAGRVLSRLDCQIRHRRWQRSQDGHHLGRAGSDR